MRRLVLALCLLALPIGAWGAWRFSGSRTVQLFGTLVARVETADSVVALTFDDGPTPAATDSVLAMLGRERVPATFFVIGSELERYPDLGARYVRAGHELGNHTFSHRRMLLRSPSFIRREIERTDSLIRRAGHAGPIHFRPPYGKKLVFLPWYLSRTGRRTIMWDVEPDSDPETAASPERVVAAVIRETRPGSIVILHVMYPSGRGSLDALPGIIQGLKRRGYRFVTVSELIAS